MTEPWRDREEESADRVASMLALPPIPPNRLYSDGECFDPWDLFPAVYGSYSSEFDELAIAVLEDIRHGTHKREDLANEIFREMLCTAGLCAYGTSPRVCFPTQSFGRLLDALIDRWKEYAAIKWSA